MKDIKKSAVQPRSNLKYKILGIVMGIVIVILFALYQIGSASLKESGTNTASLNNQGMALFSQGEYEAAIPYFDKALAINPDDAIALNNKGAALLNLHKYEEAIPYLDKALEITPDFALASRNKGMALIRLNRYEEAIPYFDKALELVPDDAFALNNEGVALMNLNKYAEANAYFDKALKIEPNDPSTLNNKGLVLDKLGQHEEATKYYDRASELESASNTAAPESTGSTPISIEAPVSKPYSHDFAPELIPLLGPGGCTDPSICSFYLGSGVGFYPMGLTLSIDGVLSGTPKTAGNSNFQICVKDVGGRSACRTYTMDVQPASAENAPEDTALLGRWEGNYNIRKDYKDGCITDTTAKISICMTKQGQNFIGDMYIDFPGGFKDAITKTDEYAICMGEIHCTDIVSEDSSPSSCGELRGYIDSNGLFKLDVLQLDTIPYVGYTPAAYSGAEHVQSVDIIGNSMMVEYSYLSSNGNYNGNFLANKVSDTCNT